MEKSSRKKIVAIKFDRLKEHPQNPNRMSRTNFRKLTSHIKRTGNYEPVIVRQHPTEKDCFEIINGHHRVKALSELGAEDVDCVVWDLNNDEALILLATLNRLGGSDRLLEKANLIKKLARRFSGSELSGMLPESRKSIARLKNLGTKELATRLKGQVFLNPIVFFLSDNQKKVVDDAIAQATDPGVRGTTAQKRAWAIVKILREAKR